MPFLKYILILSTSVALADSISNSYQACSIPNIVNNNGVLSESKLNEFGSRKTAEALVKRLATQSADFSTPFEVFTFFPAKYLSALKNGLLNLHQIGHSQGTNNPELRAKTESMLIKARPTSVYESGMNIINELRPKYAAIFPTQGTPSFLLKSEGRLSLGTYGYILISFHDEVKWRATVTFDDSLNTYLNSNNKTLPPANPLQYLSANDWAHLAEKHSYNISFIEAQIWGKIDLSDIKEVLLPMKGKEVVAEKTELAAAKTLGIPVYGYDIDKFFGSRGSISSVNQMVIEKTLLYSGDKNTMKQLHEQRLSRAMDRSGCL